MLNEEPSLKMVGGDNADLGSPTGSLEGSKRLSGLRPSSSDSCLSTPEPLSLSIHKVLYIPGTAPCFLSARIKVYAVGFKSILSGFTNVYLEEDSVWAKATLPIAVESLASAAQLSLHHLLFWHLLPANTPQTCTQLGSSMHSGP